MNSNNKLNIEVISLIYRSTRYLKFITEQLKSTIDTAYGWDVGIRIVANDASLQVVEELKYLDIPYTLYYDPNPSDYYLNRVYRCWNYAGRTSEYDNICFVNSDMAFSDGWLTNLLKHHDGINIPCSRLVESGKMPSGLYGVSKNLGRNPKTFDELGWSECAEELKEDIIKPGGLYMPCVFNKSRFIESGSYPEGNIYGDGVGTLGRFIKSGDDYYFHDILECGLGMKHITVFDSLVYHIQEGEMDA